MRTDDEILDKYGQIFFDDLPDSCIEIADVKAAIKEAREEYGKAFLEWYQKLPLTKLISLWSEDGQATGFFEKSSNRLIKDFNAHLAAQNKKGELGDGAN